MTPLVTIICLCYNQGKFVASAVESVMRQDYAAIECFVVDDCSSDDSRHQIRILSEKYPMLKIIFNDKNLGMCASFNTALAQAKGEYLIDLAADDVMHRSRVSKQVACFQQLPAQYGLVFTDAWLMDENGIVFDAFYEDPSTVPSGDVFAHALKQYFICSPTIMIKRSVMDELGGYNPALAYEDYDLFVRSSRNHRYHFLNERLIFRRVVRGSDSSRWYRAYHNPHLTSTYHIHLHAQTLVRSDAELQSLIFSVAYHWRQALLLQVHDLMPLYRDLLMKLRPLSLGERLLYAVSRIIPMVPLYKSIAWIRKNIKKALRKRAFNSHYSTM